MKRMKILLFAGILLIIWMTLSAFMPSAQTGEVQASFVQILVVAILIESILQALKPIWDKSKRENIAEFYVALGLGVVIAVLGGFDIFAAAGVPLTFLLVLGPWASIFFTGLVLGRGSTAIHDLIKALQSASQRVVLKKPIV